METNLTGYEAIEAAESNNSIVLNKYADPTEGAKVVTLDEAKAIAREDPSLIVAQNANRISTDTMNDIISAWVDAELPRNPAGYESQSEEDSIVVARGRRFEEIVNLPDDQFRALYREKTGNELLPMTPDGSYTVIA